MKEVVINININSLCNGVKQFDSKYLIRKKISDILVKAVNDSELIKIKEYKIQLFGWVIKISR